MAVPDFQSWFMPLLKRLADGKDHGMSELYQVLADDMELSEGDRGQLLTSGKQLVYENRIGWARTYMKKAGLIDSPSRGVIRITDRGHSVLAKPPDKLNVKFLRQFPEFVEFHTYKQPESATANPPLVEVAQESPQDTLERVHGELEQQLAQE